MQNHPEKTFQEITSDSASLLAGIKHKVTELSRLNNLLQKQIEPALAQRCRIANFRENILIIEVENSAWATRLRYLIPELLQRLRTQKEFFRLQEIKWYIRRVETGVEKTSTQPLTLSKDSSELITETAQHINNKNLQTALNKLAKHCRQNK